MATALDRLEVQITANAQRFEQGMRGAQQSIDRFGRQVDQRLNRVERRFDAVGASMSRALRGLLPALSAGLLVRFGRQSIEFADQIGVAAERLGVTAEQLQEFRYAAEDAANIGIQQADVALQRFTRRVAEAQAGTGELLGVIEQYNISLTNADGTQRSVNDILRDYADVVQNAGSEQERLRLAFKAFDSEGAALVNVLRRGSDGLDEFARQAREAGILTNETVSEAQELDAQLTRLSQTITTELTQAFVDIGPVVVGAIEAIAWAIRQARELIMLIDTLNPLAARGAGSERQIATEAMLGAAADVQAAMEIGQGIDEAAGRFQSAVENFNRVAGTNLSPVEALRTIDTFGNLTGIEDAIGGGGQAAPALDIPSPGGGGGGSSRTETDPADTFARRIEQEQRRVTLLEDQLALMNEQVGVQEEQRIRSELIYQAQQDGVDLQAEFRDTGMTILEVIEATAAGYGHVTQAISDAELAAQALEEQQRQNEAEAQKFAQVLTDGFSDLITGAASFEDALSNIALRIADLILQMYILRPLMEGLSGGGGGGFIGNLLGFGGGKAVGGPVDPSKWYMVGERGPEVFVPNVPGQIVPNGSVRAGMGGGGTNVTMPITINAPGADPRQLEMVRREVEGLKRSLPGTILEVTGAGQRNRRLR